MLTHWMHRAEEEIEIGHAGADALLTLTIPHGAERPIRLLLEPADWKLSGPTWDGWYSITHAGDTMRFQIQVRRPGQHSARRTLVFDAPRTWTFSWRHHTAKVGQNPEA